MKTRFAFSPRLAFHSFHSLCVRLTAYFGDKEVLWRDRSGLAGLVDVPKWIVAKSVMVLGFEGGAKARKPIKTVNSTLSI